MQKKILALVMALLLASLALVACKEDVPPVINPSQSTDSFESSGPDLWDSGKIGESELTWEMYSDGTLYIKGVGDMGELERGEGGSVIQPWYEYMNDPAGDSITKVVVESGVTSIASAAFSNCVKLQSAEIASSVTVLPEKCFWYCDALRTVTAKGVVQIMDNALDSCVKLSTVTFSASLELVGDGAFRNAGTQSQSFSVRLAGTAEEWDTAKAKMDADENDELSIWTGNEKLITGLEKVAFVNKEQ